ncbi:MAG: ABC transporter substrate-binding protein [Oligoflexus sp.]|nr:ABC transporter substrate-binding protein [Oligoflexus sp.]
MGNRKGTLRLSLYAATSCLLILLSQFLLACQRCDSPELVRIGLTPWPPFEYLFLAEKKGFFEKRGIKVKLVEYTAVEDSRRAFERGQIDIMGISPSDIILARQNSKKPAQVIAVIDFSNGADVVVAKSSIRTTKDLKNRKVGAEITTVSSYLLLKALESGGLSLEDVTIEAVNQVDMYKAMKSGNIQAASTYPPYSLDLLSNQDYHVIFNSSQIPGQIIDVLAANAHDIERRRADYAKVLLGYFEAVDYAKKYPEESIEFMAEREHMSSVDFERSFDKVVMVSLDEQLTFLGPGGKFKGLIDQVANTMIKLGHYDPGSKVSGTWTDMVIESAMEQSKKSGK